MNRNQQQWAKIAKKALDVFQEDFTADTRPAKIRIELDAMASALINLFLLDEVTNAPSLDEVFELLRDKFDIGSGLNAAQRLVEWCASVEYNLIDPDAEEDKEKQLDRLNSDRKAIFEEASDLLSALNADDDEI